MDININSLYSQVSAQGVDNQAVVYAAPGNNGEKSATGVQPGAKSLTLRDVSQDANPDPNAKIDNQQIRNELFKSLSADKPDPAVLDQIRTKLGISGENDQTVADTDLKARDVRDAIELSRANQKTVNEQMDKAMHGVTFDNRAKTLVMKAIEKNANHPLVAAFLKEDGGTLENLMAVCKLAAKANADSTELWALGYLEGFASVSEAKVENVNLVSDNRRQEGFEAGKRDHDAVVKKMNEEKASSNVEIEKKQVKKQEGTKPSEPSVVQSGDKPKVQSGDKPKVKVADSQVQKQEGTKPSEPSVVQTGDKSKVQSGDKPKVNVADGQIKKPNDAGTNLEETFDKGVRENIKDLFVFSDETNDWDDDKKDFVTEFLTNKAAESKANMIQGHKDSQSLSFASSILLKDKDLEFAGYLFEAFNTRDVLANSVFSATPTGKEKLALALLNKEFTAIPQREGLVYKLASNVFDEMKTSEKGAKPEKSSSPKLPSAKTPGKFEKLKASVLLSAGHLPGSDDEDNDEALRVSKQARKLNRDFLTELKNRLIANFKTPLENVKSVDLKNEIAKINAEINIKFIKGIYAHELKAGEAKSILLQPEGSSVCYMAAPVNALLAKGQFQAVTDPMKIKEQNKYVGLTFQLPDEVGKTVGAQTISIRKEEADYLRSNGKFNELSLPSFVQYLYIATLKLHVLQENKDIKADDLKDINALMSSDNNSKVKAAFQKAMGDLPISEFGKASESMALLGYKEASFELFNARPSAENDKIERETNVDPSACFNNWRNVKYLMDTHKDNGVALMNISNNHFVAVTDVYYNGENDYGFIVRDSNAENVKKEVVQKVNVTDPTNVIAVNFYTRNEPQGAGNANNGLQ